VRVKKIPNSSGVRKPIHKCVVIARHFDPLSIFRKESARNCASANELGHGAGDGFGLLPSHRQ
jgi:hypothetical protein